ncbi:sigma-70 family RNA polymerase sigma factor [Halosquirtibacter xylanolyticus]|uniref:RNA polymerase sigma factor n=1 Tax=Halosquirtibacter xylanolyticus TaxID=3374599 RepID=UPI003749FA1D|nr:sigma-70 family RNA polymerase sigma factor [Prolixibacteraceae bacterium]
MNQKKKESLFYEILESNDEKIKRICHYYYRDPEGRKDIYQEVLTNIWKSLEHFRGDAALSTWVYRVTVNTALTHIRKISQEKQLFLHKEQDNLSELINHNEDSWQLEDHIAQLECEINQLSMIDKMLITLMLEKLSMEEISNIVGIGVSNVRVKIHRIKETLRKKMIL